MQGQMLARGHGTGKPTNKNGGQPKAGFQRSKGRKKKSNTFLSGCEVHKVNSYPVPQCIFKDPLQAISPLSPGGNRSRGATESTEQADATARNQNQVHLPQKFMRALWLQLLFKFLEKNLTCLGSSHYKKEEFVTFCFPLLPQTPIHLETNVCPPSLLLAP